MAVVIDPLVTIMGTKWGDVAVPEPKHGSYKGTTATAVDGALNTAAYFVGTKLRPDRAKVEMEFLFLEADVWAGVLKLFDEEQGGKFVNRVRFLNQDTNKYTVREMYVSDRNNAGVLMRDPRTGKVLGYQDPRFALVEV